MKQHKTISFGDLLCLCSMAELFVEKSRKPELFEEEWKIAHDLKWFVLQCDTDKFEISESE